MLYRRVLLLCLFLIPVLSGFSQTEDYLDNLKQFSIENPWEKVYVHTDRDIYSNNEKIYFQVYLLDARTHEFSQLSKVVYVDLLKQDSTLLVRQTIYVEDGTGRGSIQVNVNEPGHLYLRAFTRYQTETTPEYVFQKVLPVTLPFERDIVFDHITPQEKNKKNKDSRPDIKFLPEGGNLLAGDFVTVAFKGIDSNGLGFSFEGRVIDETGNQAAAFNSNELGMGKMIARFEAGKKYHAEVDYNGETLDYEFPPVLDQGYGLSAVIMDGNMTVLGKYVGTPVKDFSVVIHSRGIIYGTVSSTNGNLLTRGSTDMFPEGILTLTLYDENGIIHANRLIYIDKDPSLNGPVINTEAEYGKREKAQLKLRLPDESELDSAKVSVSIARHDFFSDEDLSIRDFLLLKSDLKGNIEDPGRYFNMDNQNRLAELDLLMLTQGWRRYAPDDISTETPAKINSLPERGMTLAGKMTDFYNERKGIKGKVYLSFIENPLYSGEFETDEEGKFEIRNILLDEPMQLVLQSRKTTKRERDFDKRDPVKIILEEPEYNLPGLPLAEEKAEDVNELRFSELVQNKQDIDEAYFANNEVIMLKGVEVEAEKVDITEGRPILYNEPTRRMVMDSMKVGGNMQVIDMLRMAPGVQVTGTFPNVQFIIRGISSITGGNSALILFDGIIVSSDFLFGMMASEVEFIDILSGANAAAFGSQGGNGVIALYSKRGRGGDNGFDSMSRDWGINIYPLTGFQEPQEFYAPNYSVKKKEHIKPDYRLTLHWKGGITLKNGTDEIIEFYTSDEVANYRIVLEGVGSDGTVITARGELGVR